MACFSLSVLYHYEFFNIRQTLLGSMKVEGFWGGFTFLTGVFSGQIQHPNSKAIILAVLAFSGFSAFSIFKDAKDIRVDFWEGRNTIYTVLHRKHIRIRRINYVLSSSMAALLLTAGAAYYPLLSVALLMHLLLTCAIFITGLRIHRELMFQVFMILVCGTILNMILYEYGFKYAWSNA